MVGPDYIGECTHYGYRFVPVCRDAFGIFACLQFRDIFLLAHQSLAQLGTIA